MFKEFSKRTLDRRRFLILGGQLAAVSLFPLPALAAIERLLQPERRLSFYNTHTGERLTATYFRNGHYAANVLKDINQILRDHRTGEVRTIEPHLMDILHALSLRLGVDAHFHVISGYRSPKSNAMLRKRSSNVASSSLHMLGKAIDVRLPGLSTAVLSEAAVGLRAGGVGYYPRSDFVHIDTGRVRTW